MKEHIFLLQNSWAKYFHHRVSSVLCLLDIPWESLQQVLISQFVRDLLTETTKFKFFKPQVHKLFCELSIQKLFIQELAK